MLKQLFIAFLSLSNLSTRVPDTKEIFLDHRETQDHFNYHDVLPFWNDVNFNMQEALSAAFKTLESNVQKLKEEKEEVSMPTSHEEQLLEKLSSKHLFPCTVRVRYATAQGYAAVRLQLENSYCWHYGDCFPTLYMCNKKAFSEKAVTLKTEIPSDKKPKVTVYLSRKRPLSMRSQKILYSIDVDFTK